MKIIDFEQLPPQMRTEAVRKYHTILSGRKTSLVFKRIFDVLVSLVLLEVLSPAFLVLAVAIKLDSPGPVFFRQERVTQYGRRFRFHKFRTMVTGADKGSQVTVNHDSRITRIGRVIRGCRLDEIPQIINILKGDMSVVGPRPERKVLADEICKDVPEFAYRLKVRGGLTGYAQIYGKYNTSPYDKLRLDMMYMENYSLLLDIKLILLTIRILFSRDSTEGIDKAEETRRQADELLQNLDQQ